MLKSENTTSPASITLRTRKGLERSLLAAIWKYADKCASACGHEKNIEEHEEFLVFKVFPLIEEAMRTAHAAGVNGVSWEEWAKAKKNLVLPCI